MSRKGAGFHGPRHQVSSNEFEGAGWFGGPRPFLNSIRVDGAERGLLFSDDFELL